MSSQEVQGKKFAAHNFSAASWDVPLGHVDRWKKVLEAE
jgi:hypothetical protein